MKTFELYLGPLHDWTQKADTPEEALRIFLGDDYDFFCHLYRVVEVIVH